MVYDTVWKIIFAHLKEQGINVYAPNQHKGECLTPYVVVTMSGTLNSLSVSSYIQRYTFLLYVPANKYSFMEGYKKHVKQALDGLYPMIRDEYTETSDFYDEDKNAYMVSMVYDNYRKKTK